jgi:hypothetical protein
VGGSSFFKFTISISFIDEDDFDDDRKMSACTPFVRVSISSKELIKKRSIA